nr:hypothetical protein [Paenibacillus sp. AR247]
MNKRKISSLLAVTCITALIVSGCGGGSGKAEDKVVSEKDYEPYSKYESPVEFTIGRNTSHTNNLPKGDSIENNMATRYVESKVNVKAKVAWETDDMDQKLSLSMTTGELPDVMLVSRTIFNQLVDNDLIEDMTEVYEKNRLRGRQKHLLFLRGSAARSSESRRQNHGPADDEYRQPASAAVDSQRLAGQGRRQAAAVGGRCVEPG